MQATSMRLTAGSLLTVRLNTIAQTVGSWLNSESITVTTVYSGLSLVAPDPQESGTTVPWQS